ncbi:MAG: hemolysin III family protein [Thermotogota bacterium]|nr:hemolysin III family protein [Thermotogota bacterium]
MKNMERFDKNEELFNSISHGSGVLFAITALVLISVFAGKTGDAWKIVSGVIYGISLVALFTASTLYHAFPKGKVKDVFEIMDHSAIFILIAGTYTPFTLVSLRGPIGWTIFGIVWGLTFVGIVYKIFFVNKFVIFSTLIYIFMGWIIVFAMAPLAESLPSAGLFWLVLGGVLYTLGTPFYIIRKIPFHHGIWHLFVLGGSVSHFVTILFYVIL